MTRREIIKYTATLTGAALATPIVTSLLSGCQGTVKSNDATKTLHFFDSEEFTILQRIVDTILPKTDSPSATDVGVDYIIDSMVGQVYDREAKREYRANFDELKGLLSNVTDEALADKLEELLSSNRSEALLQLKQQTVSYYLTTEEISTTYLNYLPIPGEYEGCIELSSVDNKAWAI